MHESLHLAWWNFARTCNWTISRTLLNVKVKVTFFLCFLCAWCCGYPLAVLSLDQGLMILFCCLLGWMKFQYRSVCSKQSQRLFVFTAAYFSVWLKLTDRINCHFCVLLIKLFSLSLTVLCFVVDLQFWQSNTKIISQLIDCRHTVCRMVFNVLSQCVVENCWLCVKRVRMWYI